MVDFSKFFGKDSKALFAILGITVVGLTAIHYYHQIKLARLNIERLERENGTV